MTEPLTLEDIEQSCKTNAADSTMADTNSRSFNSHTQRGRFGVKLETCFRVGLEVRVPEREEVQTLEKNKFSSQEECEAVSSVVEKAKDLVVKKQVIEAKKKQLEKQREQRQDILSEITDGPTLRDRFSHLLPNDLKIKIGYSHIKLLHKISSLQRSITLLNKNNHQKSLPLSQIQKHLKIRKETIDQNDIRQIIFLNNNFDSMFAFEWGKKGKDEYELNVRICSAEVYNEKDRKCRFRRSICRFLLEKYAEYLREKKVDVGRMTFTSIDTWEHGFNVDTVQIPLANYPDHPLERKLSLAFMKPEEIEQITNTNLKQVIKDTISLHSTTTNQKLQQSKYQYFTNKLYETVQAKESFYEDEKKLVGTKEVGMKKELLVKFCEQSCALFTERRVSNMFRINFLDCMKKRMGETNTLTELENILNHIISKDTKFLTKVQSQKGIMIQISKQNYQAILKTLETM